MNIEKARISDAPQIHGLINHFASNDEMPTREYSPQELDALPDFLIRAVAEGQAKPEEARAIMASRYGVM